MKKRKSIVISVILALSLQIGKAQVGIDNPSPDPYSILDLTAKDKGLLIPRMTTSERFALKTSCFGSCPDGLLVYDTDKNTFFYLDANVWYTLNPWYAPDASISGAEDIYNNTTLVADLGLGASPAAGYKLDVFGNAHISSNLNVNGNASIQGNIITSSGDIKTTSGDIIANNYSSNTATIAVAGPVPVNGIIMWSGSVGAIPAGWHLCDGYGGTPDLRGKMIIAHGGGGYSVNNQGSGTLAVGSSTVSWASGATVSHNHQWGRMIVYGDKNGWNYDLFTFDNLGNSIYALSDTTWGAASGSGDDQTVGGGNKNTATNYYTKSASISKADWNTNQNAHTHTITSGPSMDYYVLAFIMKE